jgi:outer membrane receptor protein involved in Fe transport
MEPGTQRPNPDLKHERIRTWELSIEQRLSPVLMLYSSYYDFTMSNLIDPVVDPIGSLVQFRNISEAKAAGVEIELLARFNGVTLSASGALQSSTDGVTGRRLSNSPGTILKMHCSVPLTGTLSCALMLHYESARLTVYDTYADPFAVADLHVRAGRIFGVCDASLLVRNLFDARYAYPGGIEHVQPTIPQDGRSVSVCLGVSL